MKHKPAVPATSGGRTVRRLIGRTVWFLLLASFSRSLTGQPLAGPAILTEADSMPCFPACPELPAYTPAFRACSEKALAEWLSRNMKYPEPARRQGTEGTVTVSFVVRPDGTVEQVEVLHDIGAGCGEAAAGAVQAMPAWWPGRHRGRPVAVRMSLPVRFRLRDQATTHWLAWGALSGETVGRKALLANLDTPVSVRDATGRDVPVQRLVVSYRYRHRRQHRIGAGPLLSPAQVALLRKARRGGTVILEVDYRTDGQPQSLSRTFRLVGTRRS